MVVCVCLFNNPALAADALLNAAGNSTEAVSDSDLGIRNGSLIVAPIPFSNDAIGSGLTLGAGYLFNIDSSRPSVFGLAYMETSNGTNLIAGGGNIVFDENHWTLSMGVVDGTINYDLPINFPLLGETDVPLSQSIRGGGGRLAYGFSNAIEVGITLSFAETQIALDTDLISSLPEFLQPDLNVELARLTFNMKYDTRDDTFYPLIGSLVSADLTVAHVESKFFRGRFAASDREYQKAIFKANHYRSINDTAVIAGSAVACGADSDAPFFDSCGVGFVDGLRGFSSLGALEDWTAAVQIELRQRIGKRFGFVAFAGAGAGGNRVSDLSFNNGGSALGVGARFQLTKNFGLDYSIDYARNNDGEDFLYLYVGQRF